MIKLYRSVTCCRFFSLTEFALNWQHFRLSFALVAEHPEHKVMGGSIPRSIYVKRLFDALGEGELTRRGLMPPAMAAAALLLPAVWGLSPVSCWTTFIQISHGTAPGTCLVFLSGHAVDLLDAASAVILKGLNKFYSCGRESSRACQVRGRKDSKLLNLSCQIWGQV